MFPGGKLGHRKGDEHKNEYEVEGANQTMRLP
jgi:hypothetical protein